MLRLIPVITAGALLTGNAYAEDDESTALDDTPHITMTGTAHLEARPDLATITLGVTTERAQATAAAAESAAKTRAIIDAAKASGIPAADIATQAVTLTQTFDPVKDKNGNEIGRKPRGFAAENTVAIKLRDLARAGAIVEDLIGRGANRFDGIEFSVEHPEPITNRLVSAAVKNARAQAEAAAETAGVKLGRVLLIERPGDPELPHRFTRSKVAAAPSMAMPLEAGMAAYHTSMNVTWALDPK